MTDIHERERERQRERLQGMEDKNLFFQHLKTNYCIDTYVPDFKNPDIDTSVKQM